MLRAYGAQAFLGGQTTNIDSLGLPSDWYAGEQASPVSNDAPMLGSGFFDNVSISDITGAVSDVSHLLVGSQGQTTPGKSPPPTVINAQPPAASALPSMPLMLGAAAILAFILLRK